MSKFGIGQSVKRVEDQRFLTGMGRYVDDMALPRMAHGFILHSPHAHAKIKRVDVSKAKAAPGVLLVLTGADAVADKLGSFTSRREARHLTPQAVVEPKDHRTFLPILLADRVRVVGDRVAFVVAETLAQAMDAAELIEVDYEPLPSVTNLDDAVKEGAPQIWEDCPNGNVAFGLAYGNKDKTDAAFAAARHVVKLRVENNRIAPNAMEPRVSIGEYSSADDFYTLHTCSQNPHGVRQEIANIFNCSETRVRVISPDVGGGFGLKAGAFPDDILTLWASKKIGRPVKWRATRSESIMTDLHGRELVTYAEMALDEKGKILGLRAQSLFQVGAYFLGAVLAPAIFSQRFLTGAYDIQNIHITLRGLFTNTVQIGAYRGAGRPEAAYVTERLIDHAARTCGFDPVEIRRINLIPPAKLPYSTPTYWVYDSGNFEHVLDKCLEFGDWTGYAAREKETKKKGKLRGRAVSFYIEQGGIFNERMDLRFDPSGSVTIFAGTHSHGQGHATVFAQIVNEMLGIDFEKIRFVQGDTDRVSIGRGTYGARGSVCGGNALKNAADLIIKKAKPMATALLEAAETDIEFKDGSFRVVGTDKSISLVDVAKAFYAPMGPLTAKFGVGLEAAGSFELEVPNHPNGAHVCEVEVDPETGMVEVDRYYVIDDVGRALNPMVIHGQVHGGVAQGIGQALVEHAVYDRESGQLISGSFMDYGMPRARLFSSFETDLVEIPSKTNPLGVKGIGESGTIGGPPTIINAILDALKPLGVTDIDMPATPLKVWNTIQAARLRVAAE